MAADSRQRLKEFHARTKMPKAQLARILRVSETSVRGWLGATVPSAANSRQIHDRLDAYERNREMTDDEFKLGMMRTLGDIVWALDDRMNEISKQRFRDFSNSFYRDS